MKLRVARQIKVGLLFDRDVIPVGRLALRERQIYFEYDDTFLDRGLEISPLKCPLRPGVQTFDYSLFEGLPGVFNDSLPDGWGRLLLDRQMRSQGILPEHISPLDRLARVGHTGMGALVYEPDYAETDVETPVDLNQLAVQVKSVLDGEAANVLQQLLMLNGASSGMRPKAMIDVDSDREEIIHGADGLREGFEPWLVKFPNTHDGMDAGAIEYVYALMAHKAGLDMPPTYMFSAQKGPGFFAVKRFDRDGRKRLHVHSVCGLLHSDFRTPSLDYEDLLALTMILTRDIRAVEKMFRLAVFNVLAHNRDDHAKNFSFLMDAAGQWQLSPAYDLTFSPGLRGEQSMMVMGEGMNLSVEHLVKLGKEAKIPQTTIDAIIEQTQDALGDWRQLAVEYGVSKVNVNLIEKMFVSFKNRSRLLPSP